ncbi:unnamed protein product [Parnassius apollo]|uniref:(apollo) hypothetical protein n=1 Tax=Parnassius apollo TaxID=110799 RepID=A0A8S3WHZ7_PARAO|nr:unnamed protein product [Parnassius apollo]
MRGYNSLKNDLAKKHQEMDAETKNHAIKQEQENTPYKKSEKFVNEDLTDVATPVKETIKKDFRIQCSHGLLNQNLKPRYV